MLRLTAARTLAVLALVGCSDEPLLEPSARARQPIAGGELDREHNEVVEIVTEFGENAVGLCTGTLIAPNLVLTARHCVARSGGENVVCGSSPFSAPVPAGGIHVTTASSPSHSSVFFDGRSVSVPPEGNDTCGFDLALVTLARNVPPDVARPAVPRIDVRAISGEAYVALGYGIDDDGNATAGRMRLDGLVVQCSAGRCGNFLTDTEFLGEEGVCSGDSGGPALDEEGRVIGVLSRGSDPCATPVYGGVFGFRDWIMRTGLAAAEAGGYEPPFWVLSGTSVRPPGVEGDPCASGGDCSDGSACYYESDPLFARCTRTCTSSDDCSEPSVCRSGFDVPSGGLCLAPERPVDEPRQGKESDSSGGSCSMPRSPRPTAAPAFVAAALAIALRRRRKARGLR
jgi:hypothetical protein